MPIFNLKKGERECYMRDIAKILGQENEGNPTISIMLFLYFI